MRDVNIQNGGSRNKQKIDNSSGKESVIIKIVVGIAVGVVGAVLSYLIIEWLK